MNVKFFPLKFAQTEENLKRLEALQIRLSEHHAEFANAVKGMAPGEIYLAKQRFHAGFRDHWKIYEGFKVDETKKSS